MLLLLFVLLVFFLRLFLLLLHCEDPEATRWREHGRQRTYVAPGCVEDMVLANDRVADRVCRYYGPHTIGSISRMVLVARRFSLLFGQSLSQG